jgi:predicted nicotinamide N-methyase
MSATCGDVSARLRKFTPAATLPATVQPRSPTTVPEAHNDPALRRYALRRLRLPIGASPLSVVIPDASAWIRRGTWAEATMRGSEPPYWVQVWPASVAIARWLWRRKDLAGLKVLDLGCGLGIPGIAAAALGADVTFADREADALAFATWNAARVGDPRRVSSHRLDWAATTVPGQFDVIVLADVTYRPLHHAGLRRQIAACLRPEGIVLHGDPHRPEANDFVRWLHGGFRTQESTRETAFLDRRARVRLCAASRSDTTLQQWTAFMTPDAGSGGGSVAATPFGHDAPSRHAANPGNEAEQALSQQGAIGSRSGSGSDTSRSVSVRQDTGSESNRGHESDLGRDTNPGPNTVLGPAGNPRSNTTRAALAPADPNRSPA